MDYQDSGQGLAMTKDCALLPARKTNGGPRVMATYYTDKIHLSEGLPRCIISAVSGSYAISGEWRTSGTQGFTAPWMEKGHLSAGENPTGLTLHWPHPQCCSHASPGWAGQAPAQAPQHHRNLFASSRFIQVLLGVPDFLRAIFAIFIQYKPHAKDYCTARKQALLKTEGWKSYILAC